MKTKVHEISRHDLYELVWSKPMTKLSVQFGLSDVGLKKICQRHDIPVPSRGYWQKLKTGIRVPKTPLPKSSNAPDLAIRVLNRNSSLQEHADSSEVAAQVAFEQAPEHQIVVAERLSKKHPATLAFESALKTEVPDKYGVLKCRSIEPCRLRIGPKSIQRVLRILNALFKAFEARDFVIRSNNATHPGGCVLVHGEDIQFSIEERVRKLPNPELKKQQSARRRGDWSYYPDHVFVPSGELTLKLHTGYGSSLRSNWSDTKRNRIEDCLNAFIVEIVRLAIWKRKQREVREEMERQRAEELARIAALRERQEVERARVDQLMADAMAFNQAEIIRKFIAAVLEQGVSPTRAAIDDVEHRQYVKWASAQADRLDPLCESPKSILDETLPDHRNPYGNF